MPGQVVLGLSAEARGTITECGVTVREYLDFWGHVDGWRGDVCGCSDDRCEDYHHDAGEECFCLPVLLRILLDERATRASNVRQGKA